MILLIGNQESTLWVASVLAGMTGDFNPETMTISPDEPISPIAERYSYILCDRMPGVRWVHYADAIVLCRDKTMEWTKCRWESTWSLNLDDESV